MEMWSTHHEIWAKRMADEEKFNVQPELATVTYLPDRLSERLSERLGGTPLQEMTDVKKGGLWKTPTTSSS